MKEQGIIRSDTRSIDYLEQHLINHGLIKEAKPDGYKAVSTNVDWMPMFDSGNIRLTSVFDDPEAATK